MVALDSLHGGLMSQQNSFELISPCSINEQVLDLSSYPGSPETETYEVELRKNVYGMGIKSNQMINNIDYTIFFSFCSSKRSWNYRCRFLTFFSLNLLII